MVRYQQIAFLLQEGAISILYIVYAHRLLKPNSHVRERRVVWDLVAVSAAVISTDLVVILLAFTNEHVLKEPLQNFSYALKLELEFFVLNQLLEVSGAGFGPPAAAATGHGGVRRSRYHAPTASDASKAWVLEKGAEPSAQRAPSDDSGLSHLDQGIPLQPPMSSPSTDRTVVPPNAAHMRNASVQSHTSAPAVQSPVSPLASSPDTKVDFFIPRAAGAGHISAVDAGPAEHRTAERADVVAPLRVSSRNGARLDRALPPEPRVVEQPPSRSWLDLESRMTDVERKLNAMA